VDYIIADSKRAVKLSEAAKSIYRECDAAVAKRVMAHNGITSPDQFKSRLTVGEFVDMYRAMIATRGRRLYKTPFRSLARPVNRPAIYELVDAGMVKIIESKSNGSKLLLRVDTRGDWFDSGKAVYNVI
jgi:hypothetical protein